jgi:glycosyltransferase involved in cell wall biosynthesis
MRIAFLSTRIKGLDGVSLEIYKWAFIFSELGHEIFYCAGELDDLPNSSLITEMHFQHPGIVEINNLAFNHTESSTELTQTIESYTALLYEKIAHFVQENQVEIIVAENILAIPMNIPLGIALSRFIKTERIPVIAHHHDFFWERERFSMNCIPAILEANFPPRDIHITHVVINSLAQQDLLERTGIHAEIIPNIFDFRRKTFYFEDTVIKVRKMLQISPDEIMVLQPTRIIPRKGIELAIELVAEMRKSSALEKLANKKAKLVFSHPSGDEGNAYLEMLLKKAAVLHVPIIQGHDLFSGGVNLWDVYQASDLVTYPSYTEGFGNALLEAIYFRKVIVINRYPVYEKDIKPLGFDLLEMDGQVTRDLIDQVIEIINNDKRVLEMTENNFNLAQRCFSYEAIQPKLDKIIGILKQQN